MSLTLKRLQTFVQFCQRHITGDEKEDAQIFLERFFQAFGRTGVLETSAVYEKNIPKSRQKSFVNLVWKSCVLIEIKKRGTDLSKHYSQAFDNWQRAVPDRPPYVLLCNFDEFWIYDFDTQIDTPIDLINLENLPQRASALAFMEKGQRQPIFCNNQTIVTEKVARRMGELLVALKKRGIHPFVARRFILQCVLVMFAEDRSLCPDNRFIQCIQACLSGKRSDDVLAHTLFQTINKPGTTPVGWGNNAKGSLCQTIHSLKLTRSELEFLEAIALENWSKVRPAIFGNIFESAIDDTKRHAHGIHYTTEADIMKIVRPTISRYWEERIEHANSNTQLNCLKLELQNYRVLDPACGSGNFLYIAYQELKQIEQTLFDKIAEHRRFPRDPIQMDVVTPHQFFGIDNNPFSVELARITLTIASKVAIARLGCVEPALLLDTLDNNIVCQDALFAQWPKVNAIIGNPPFLGGSRIRSELGDSYAEKVFETFSNIRAQVDLASYWFRLAHEQIDDSGRAGLVSTNSIRQGKSRSVSLNYIADNGGYIYEAISTQPWSGKANVHVSFVNWCKQKPTARYLDNYPVANINSSLTSTVNVGIAKPLKANLNHSFVGVQPNGKGFYLSKEQANAWIEINPENRTVVKLSSSAKDLTDKPNGRPERWIVDFADMTLEEISGYSLPLEQIKTHVRPARKTNREKVLREKWWRFKRTNEAMRTALAPLPLFFSIPRHSKWFIFIPAQPNWLPADSTAVVASGDFYILGLLTSHIHRVWVNAQSSTLEERTRYTPRTCFETFPFPQSPTPQLVKQIRTAALKLHEYRSQAMETKQWGITKLYNAYFKQPTSPLYKLHKALDVLVMQAYDFSKDDDLLEQLLALNLALADREKQGKATIGPWAPGITTECSPAFKSSSLLSKLL